MSKYASPAFSSAETIAFPNGTRLTAPFGGTATQWINDSGGFRAARLPAQEDTVPVLQSALDNMGFIEQETIHVDVASLPVSATAALRSPSRIDADDGDTAKATAADSRLDAGAETAPGDTSACSLRFAA